jgi:uncharacterized DUF497 family protein
LQVSKANGTHGVPLSFSAETRRRARGAFPVTEQDRDIAAQAFRDFDVVAKCIYSMNIEFSWSTARRTSNLDRHGLDFADAERVFAGLTFTFEDDRFNYGEQRYVTLGLLDSLPVSLVHTETSHEIRVISFRQATPSEACIHFEQVGT